LCAVVLHGRVYDDFEAQRLHVVRGQHSNAQGTITVQLPDLSPLAGQPAALVLRVSNERPETRVLRVAANGTTVAEVSLAGDRETRVDLVLQNSDALSPGDDLTLTSDGDGWLLAFLEVANIYGFSRGLFEFVVVPASARPADRPAVLASLTVFAILMLFPGIPLDTLRNKFVRGTYLALASLVVLLLIAVLVAPWISSFGVLLAAHTFALCVVLLYAPALPAVARSVVRSAPSTLPRAWERVWSRRVLVAYLALLTLFVISITKLYEPAAGMTVLIRFGEQFEDRVLPSVRAVPHYIEDDSAGYDGQFYAQLAVDPLLRDPALGDALDAPAYRARRIFFSWTAFLLGLGQPRWVLQAYATQYVILWLLLAWVLCRWFPPRDLQSLCLWFGCMFSHGMVISVIAAVPDGASMLLLAIGVLAIERGRLRRTAGLVGLASLAKDVNLLWSAVLIVPDGLKRYGWRDLCVWGLMVAGPLSLWMLYVAATLGIEGVGGGRNFATPLAGYLGNWSLTYAALGDEGWDSYARLSLYAMVGLTTQSAVLLAVRDWRNPWWRAGLGSVVLMIFLGPAVWEGYPGAVTRVLLPMTFAFNAVLPRNRWFWPLFVLGNLSVLPGLEVLRVPFWDYI